MPPKTLSLRFPSMGVIRRQPQERVYSAPSYPTPWSMNVRLEDVLTKRLRGGSFAGIIGAGRFAPIVYRDRTLTFSDNAITASRKGDSSDTDLSSDLSDTARPALFQLAEDDGNGDDVVALVPHKDRTMLGFTAGETWLLTGDPVTGTLHNISREVGIIGVDAWDKREDTIFFMSVHGLYSIGADGSGLKALSEDAIPEDLTGVVDASCVLTYRHVDRGVYIHLTVDPDWFYDTERGGFWPYDDSGESHLLVGPLRLGSPNQFGLIQTIHGIMAASSATVNWAIVVGDSAEEASANGKSAITAALAGEDFQEYVAADGSWDAGRSNTGWPRVRAPWAVIWLSSAGTWAFGGITIESIPFGRIR